MNVRDTENSRLLDSTQPMNDGDEEEDEPEGKFSRYCNPLVYIIVFLVVIMILMLSLVVFWRMEGSKIVILKTRNECTTAECITLAGTLLNWQNTSVDPCDDFYEYACGKYQEHTMNDGTRVNEKDTIVMKLIKQFVLKDQPTTSRSENALKLLYKVCTKSHLPENMQNHIETIQTEVFQNIRKIGSWPIVDKNWDESKFDLNDMLSNMAKLHMFRFGLFETGLIEYPMNGSPKQIVIRPSLNRFEVPLEELVKTVYDVLRLNGVDALKKNLTKAVQESLDLDKELENFQASHDLQPAPASLSELKAAVPNIDFERIIKSFMHPDHGNWTSLQNRISSGRFDTFFNPKRNISSIIAKTKPRILANYLILKYVEYSHFYYSLIPKFNEENNQCLEIIVTILPRAALRVFVRNHFKKENMAAASKMVDVIKDAFIEMFQNCTWLHEPTRKNAILKVEKMKTVIGYTEEYEKEGALDEIFKTLHVTPEDSFFTLMTKINRFKTEQLMDYMSSDSLLNPIDPLVYANAFYFPTKNLLNVLIPFLDKPLFDFQYPRYVAMAGVGRVLAHEIGHAFDIHGRHLNEIGRMENWWTPEDSDEYERRAGCFKRQFQHFKDPVYGGNQNGTDVLAEIMADALGLEATWRAFEKMDMSKEQSLIKFENQDFRRMYFRVAALDFCSPTRIDAHSPRYMNQLSHPTHRFRINGAFSNLKSFAEAYKCPVGSKMNLVERCGMF